jgi:tRNA modification GTPase
MFEDTIIAISTPPGQGGLGIVRLSGKKALAIAKKVFNPQKGPVPTGKPVFGVIQGSNKDGPLDEAFLTYFQAPRSYTREDVVEISCHGSPVVLEEIVRLGVKLGARHAHPGEFTLRAYLNGRLDIIQAEAVNDLIRAVSLTQARISFKQLGGSLSRRIGSIREKIIHVLSRVEAGIEFPDENLGITREGTIKELKSVIDEIKDLIAGYDAGRSLVEGITLAITGRTNVGKSTLFNALLGQERAIVTPYPGTTRDFLRERLVIHGAVFNLVDMAGLGRSNHPVEQEGMRRGERLAGEAAGVLLVFDGSRPASREDIGLLRKFRNLAIVIIINKIDLHQKFDRAMLGLLAGDIPVVKISALKGVNLGVLKKRIHGQFASSSRGREDMVLHSRQKIILEEMLEVLEAASSAFLDGYSEEVGGEELRKAIPMIGRLTGEIKVREVIDNIFSRFCIGK